MSIPADRGVTWEFASLDGMRFMRARFVQHAFPPHAHDYYVLGLIEAGVQTFAHGQQRHVTTPGKLILLNPAEIHTGEAAVSDGFVYRALYPSAALLESVAAEFQASSPWQPQFARGVVEDPTLYRWLRWLHGWSETVDSPLALDTALRRFLVALIDRHAAPSRRPPAYPPAHKAAATARAYLEAHYADPVTLADLARVTAFTPFHLARLFSREVGMPPHRYLENVRVRQAERLLRTGMPIAEAAFATGFSSQSHLTRTFKRIIGTTPGVFVNSRKIVQDTDG